MRTRLYNKDEQKVTTFYKRLKDARAEARKRGEMFEAVRAIDSYWQNEFLGYAVVLK